MSTQTTRFSTRAILCIVVILMYVREYSYELFLQYLHVKNSVSTRSSTQSRVLQNVQQNINAPGYEKIKHT